MVMTFTEQHATCAALPAIFDVQEFMALEVVARSERPIAHVARKGRLMEMLVLSEVFLTRETLSTHFTDKEPFFFTQM